MRALVYEQPGTEQPFVFRDLPTPEPGPAEVLVKVYAAALNWRETGIFMPANRPNFQPFVMGADGAGLIVAVGKEVTGWRAGDAVVMDTCLYCGHCEACQNGDHANCETIDYIGCRRLNGTFAEYLVVPARNLAAKPAHLSFAEAASLPMAFGTAWHGVTALAQPKPGETMLIHGIGSGVSLFALQIGVAMGARVIVTSGSAAKLEEARKMGAVAGLNYREDDLVARIRELTGGRGVNAIMDGGGKATMPVSLDVVARQGRIVFFGGTTGYDMSLDLGRFMMRSATLFGLNMHSHPEFVAAMRWIEQTGMRPKIHQVFPWEQWSDAFGVMRRHEQFGKIVLEIGHD